MKDDRHEIEDLEQLPPFRDRVIEPQLRRLRLLIGGFISRLRSLTPLTSQEKFEQYVDGNVYSDQYYRDRRHSKNRR